MKNVVFFIMTVLISGCVEEFQYDGATNLLDSNQNILVVEANLTNEISSQQIRLSKVVDFGNDSIALPQSNALVRVIDQNENVYEFKEKENGIYASSSTFSIKENNAYRLEIQTPNGDVFVSSQERLPEGESKIGNMVAEREILKNGMDGVTIYLENGSANTNNLPYRYEFEETYKIVAPYWTSVDFQLTDYDPCFLPIEYNLDVVPRTEEQQVCFNTLHSKGVLQLTNTSSKAAIRSIEKSDFIISNRYSILVKQLLDTQGARDFYRQLSAFNSNDFVFSQIQVGELPTNITVIAGETGVIGYFSVSNLDKKRIFFDFGDIFPNESKPDFVKNCQIFSAPLEPFAFCVNGIAPYFCEEPILEQVDDNLVSYYDQNPEEGANDCEGPFLMVDRVCGDCTVLGSNIKPDFWVD